MGRHSGATPEHTPPAIPDHTLIRCIGRGASGEVWLARNILGLWRAVKIIHRANFDSDRAYDREFSGIQSYEPVSRTHDGLMDILQVGRNDAAGCYYYVMELADPAGAATWDDPAAEPHTLAGDLERSGRLSARRAVDIGLSLIASLDHLHRNGLVHRDIKPANVIIVDGRPKLADIGLVAARSAAESIVGTLGYIPPEGPGTTQADIYALGKVLYEVSTGRDRQDFPTLPTDFGDGSDDELLAELNEILLRAGAANAAHRYRAAEEMQADLLLLKTGRSVARTRRLERRLRQVKRTALVGGVVVLLALGAGLFWNHVRTQQLERERHLRAEAETAQGVAEAEKKRALEAVEREERQNYWTTIQLVNSRIAAGQFDGVRRMLQETRMELRGWEWGYLMAKCPQPEWELAAHNGPINSMAVSSDGRLLATVGEDGVVAAWDLVTRKLKWHHQTGEPCLDVDIDAVGTTLAVANAQRVLLLVTTNGQVIKYSGAIRPIAARFGDNGRTLGIATKNLALLATRVDDWKFQQLATNSQSAFRLGRDTGRRLFAISRQNTRDVEFFDAATFESRGKWETSATAEGISSVVLVSESNRIFYADWRRAHVADWQSVTRRPSTVAEFSTAISDLDYRPDLNQCVVVIPSGLVQWRNLAANRSAEFFHDHSVNRVRLLPDGRILSAGQDGFVKCWNPALVARQPADLQVDMPGAQTGDRLAVRHDGKLMAAIGFETPWVQLIDLETLEQRRFELPGPAQRLFSFRPGSTELVIGITNAIHFYETRTNPLTLAATIPFNRLARAGNFDATGNRLIVAGRPKGVAYFEFDGVWLPRFADLATNDQHAALSGDGRWIATGSAVSASYRIVDASNGSILARFTAEKGAWETLPPLFHPRSNFLAVVEPRGVITWREIPTGNQIATTHNGLSGVSALNFTPDGVRLVASSYDFTTKVWDWKSGRALLVLTNRFYPSLSMGMTPDGLTLIRGDADPDFWIHRAVPWTNPTPSAPRYSTNKTILFPEFDYDPKLLPPRPPGTPARLIDLTRSYNANLNQTLRGRTPGNDFKSFPPGVQRLADVDFDVRGVIQFASKGDAADGRSYPRAIHGIPIGTKARRVHFLHAGSWVNIPRATKVGRYVIRYSDGTSSDFDLISNETMPGWRWKPTTPARPKSAVMAWEGTNSVSSPPEWCVRLFRATWELPFPDKPIQSMDAEAFDSPAVMMLLAITVEP